MGLNKLNKEQIKVIRQFIKRRYADPYVEIGVINEIIAILGYSGEFEYNFDNHTVKWKAHRDSECFYKN